MVAFIDQHREVFGVEPICKVLPIAPATYYVHHACKRDPELRANRAKQDELLSIEIRRVYDASFDGVYGADKDLAPASSRRRRCRALHDRAFDAENAPPRRRSRTRIQGHDDQQRSGAAPAGSRRACVELWVADITYVATWAGFVYVAFVIDVFSRAIVGWRVSSSLRSDLALDALEQAPHARPHDESLVHHSDHGVQYLSVRYTGDSPKPASSARLEASATLTTTRLPRPLMVSARPRSFADAAPGATSTTSSSRP